MYMYVYLLCSDGRGALCEVLLVARAHDQQLVVVEALCTGGRLGLNGLTSVKRYRIR